VAFDYVSLVYV